jgi:transaldolase
MREGFAAIQQLVSEGNNVKVTLLFGCAVIMGEHQHQESGLQR